MTELQNKHVVIIGASRGLGRAIARAFHAEGARVSLFARNAGDLEKLAGELGDRVATFAGDITNEDQVRRALEQFRSAHGPVDVLVNNAGIGAYKPFLERDLQELLKEIAVNFSGIVITSRIVAEEMAARRSGTIINIASDLGRKPLANMAVYTATKHAVVGLSQSLTRELRHHNVRCCVINPGIIDTFFGGSTEGNMPGDGALRVEDVARTAVFVAKQPENVLIDEMTVHPIGQEF